MSMKKYTALILVMTLLISSLGLTGQTVQANPAFDIDAESAILLDADTGKVLFEKNADLSLPPASMSKMMTEYLILEAIHEGQFGWDTVVPIGEYANFIGGSTVFLEVGQEHTVRDLFIGVAAFSGNDATVTLAELVAGSEANFVRMMNDKAKELGMENTLFVNSSGMPNNLLGNYIPAGTADDENMMSARDTAILARALVNDYPEVLEYASTVEIPEVFSHFRLDNFNWMLPDHPFVDARQHAYRDLDGLKTGFTGLAGYCFTATAERDGVRLISVVMRSETMHTRFQETRKLLDYGFNNYEHAQFSSEGQLVDGYETMHVARGKELEVPIAISGEINTVINRAEKELYHLEFVLDESLLDEKGNLIAPVSQGDIIGHVQLVYTGEKAYDFLQPELYAEMAPVVALEDVEKAGWFRLMMRGIGGFFSGLWNGIVDGVTGWFS